jgi:hypothetical protein
VAYIMLRQISASPIPSNVLISEIITTGLSLGW